MIRHVSALALALWLIPSSLSAQSVQFTVSAQSADVHKSPSTGSPLVGHAPRGTVLPVTRELGSWVKVVWPSAPDGAAYVHVRMGSISRGDARPIQARTIASAPAQQPAPSQSPLPAVVTVRNDRAVTEQPASALRTSYVAPPTHALGFGGQLGVVHRGFGGSARMWSRGRFGVQLEIARESLTSVAASDRMTTMQIAPSVLYSPRSHVSDYVSMRPYFGGGGSVHRQTLNSAVPVIDASTSQQSLGLQGFGGAEATFASLPQFALSADVGYRWCRTPLPGFDVSGMRVAVSGHWYVK